jgi:hypothetical protein
MVANSAGAKIANTNQANTILYMNVVLSCQRQAKQS